MLSRLIIAVPVSIAILAGCVRPIPKPTEASLETAEGDAANVEMIETAADVEAGPVTRVRVTTDNGPFVIEVHPEWAPIGAAHWLGLVKKGFYDDTRFFRAVPGFMAQTGISGDPEMTEEWGEKTIQDDVVRASNKRGYVTFAQTGAPNSRSTQWFISFGDNSFLDNSGQGFMPFGKVVEGMSIVDKINTEYGENNPADNVQGNLESLGNEWLDEKFPNLTKIIKIEVIGDDTTAASDGGDVPRAKELPQG